MANKKPLVLAIIGASVLFLLIIGATFAYFASSDVNDGKTSIVTGEATPVGNIAISNPTDSLHINLTILDMQEDKLGAYWATDDSALNYDETEIQRDIALITLTGGSSTTEYECSNTVNVEVTGTMVSNLSKGDAYIQFGGLLTNKIDLTELSHDGYNVTFNLNGTDVLSQNITAAIAIENRNANQNAIAGKELSVKFTNTNFSCKALGFTEADMTTTNGILAIDKTAEGNLNNYIIYGNSIQNGTPSPETPVEIQSVGEKTKNLFNFQKLQGQTGGVVNFDNKSIYLSGADNMYVIGQSFTGAPTAFNKFNEVLNISEPGYYSLSIKVDSEYEDISPRANYSLNAIGTDVTSPTIVSQVYANGYLFVKYNITEEMLNNIKVNASTFRLYLYSFKSADGSNVPVTLSEFMFVKGNYTSDTMPSYEPNGYEIPITVSGKNLFDINGEIINGYNNSLTIVGNSIVATSQGTGTYYNSKIKLSDIKAGTKVTLSAEMEASAANKPRVLVAYYDTSTTSTTVIGLLSETGSVNMTIPAKTSDNQILCLVVYSNVNGTVVAGDYVEYKNIQLELGDVVTNYASYVEPVITNIYLDEPLRKVGSIKDYIDFESRTIVRNIGEYTFDGSEKWVTTGDTLANSYQGFAVLSTDYNVKVPKTVYVLECLSNRFPYLGITQTTVANICRITTGQYGMRIIVGVDIVPNMLASEFTSWLSTHNTTMLFPLETVNPDTIELPNIPTFEGGTTIEISTTIAPSSIDISYNARP